MRAAKRSIVIAHVLNGLRFGGNENLCLQLIKNSPPDFRHVLFNIDPPRTEMKDVFAGCPNLTIVDRAYTRDTRASFIFAMMLDLKRIGADGMVVYPFGVHVFVAMSARAAGVGPLVVHAGNPPPVDPKQRQLWRKIVWASHLLCVPILSCSSMVDRELRVLAGVLPRGSEPLYNGVDVETVARLAARTREKRDPNGPRVIGMVARLNSIKDHETLLRAFACVQAELGGVELWLIGDGERRPALEALTTELGLACQVRFLGERTDVHELLGNLDVFVFSTTRDEGFGIALAEAMAARVPVVASDVGACREVLGGGETGRLVPPGDPDALASAIKVFLTDSDLVRRMIERAYARAQSQYDIKLCAERYYERLNLAGSRVRRA